MNDNTTEIVEQMDPIVVQPDDLDIPDELKRAALEIRDEQTGEVLFVQDEVEPEGEDNDEDNEVADEGRPVVL